MFKVTQEIFLTQRMATMFLSTKLKLFIKHLKIVSYTVLQV